MINDSLKGLFPVVITAVLSIDGQLPVGAGTALENGADVFHFLTDAVVV